MAISVTLAHTKKTNLVSMVPARNWSSKFSSRCGCFGLSYLFQAFTRFDLAVCLAFLFPTSACHVDDYITIVRAGNIFQETTVPLNCTVLMFTNSLYRIYPFRSLAEKAICVQRTSSSNQALQLSLPTFRILSNFSIRSSLHHLLRLSRRLREVMLEFLRASLDASDGPANVIVSNGV